MFVTLLFEHFESVMSQDISNESKKCLAVPTESLAHAWVGKSTLWALPKAGTDCKPAWQQRCFLGSMLSRRCRVFLQTLVCYFWILVRRSSYSHVSISAEASFPVVPKWILMNLPLEGKKMMLASKPEAPREE